ncbi:hypothetical protein GNT69_17925 [Bacillus sp. B15-48]|nr:hypothetical protein [Bacillus sp. B15-48]
MNHRQSLVFSLLLCMLVLLLPVSAAEANESTVYDQFQKSATEQQEDTESTSSLMEPSQQSMGKYVFQFFGAFAIIIALLYFVLRFVSKQSKLMNRSGSMFHALGGHSLGNQRSVQLLMVGETLYILGVGDSVTLIRTIPPGEEQTKILETVAVTRQETEGKWNLNFDRFKRKTKQEKWDDHLIEQLQEIQSTNAHNKDAT